MTTIKTPQGVTEFPVSGVSYFAACDPLASGVPREEGWPQPRRQKVGKGYRFWYPIEWAEKVETHMQAVGEAWTGGWVDPEVAAEGRALLRDAARVRTIRGEETQ